MYQCVGRSSSRVGSKGIPPHNVTKTKQFMHFLHLIYDSASKLQAWLLSANKKSSTRSRYRSIYWQLLEHNREGYRRAHRQEPQTLTNYWAKWIKLSICLSNRWIESNDTSERLPPLTRCAHHSKTHNLFSDILAENRRKLDKKNVIEERISEIAGFKLYE